MVTDISLPELGLFVFPAFISPEEEQHILSCIDKKPAAKKPTRNSIQRFGTKNAYRDNICSSVIPEFLDKVSEKIVAAGLLPTKPDSVTINQYLAGQAILPHIDSLASGPVITILSLLGDAVMDFTCGDDSAFTALPARCLIQMKDDIRYKWEHSLRPVASERYSIVFRCSEPKKSKMRKSDEANQEVHGTQ